MRSALRARLPFLVDSGYATLTAGSAGLLLVLLTIAGRFLSADDYGRFSYALALTTIVETIMDLGLSQVTVRSVARDRASADRLFPQVLGVKLVWVGDRARAPRRRSRRSCDPIRSSSGCATRWGSPRPSARTC